MTTELDALQQTLAGEHAAVHAYGVLAGRAAPLGLPSFRAGLTAAYDAHLTRRDDLRALVTADGGVPVAAEPSYLMPPDLTTRSAIAEEALRTEQACVGQYAALVAAGGPGPARSWAVTALGESALTALGFGGEPAPLPGVTVTPAPAPAPESSAASASAS